jgi:hypothetical protein
MPLAAFRSEAEFVQAVRDAYFDPGRRAVVESALRVKGRLTCEEAVRRYVVVLAANRTRSGGENPSGRNSHAANMAPVLR